MKAYLLPISYGTVGTRTLFVEFYEGYIKVELKHNNQITVSEFFANKPIPDYAKGVSEKIEFNEADAIQLYQITRLRLRLEKLLNESN